MTAPGETKWPSTYEYTLAHACPMCKAPAGQDCDAPRKRQSADALNRIRVKLQQPTVEPDPVTLQHARRIDLGIDHYRRDVGNAPWPEERTPGQRYDTLT